MVGSHRHDLKLLLRERAGCFTEKADGFWSTHYGFAGQTYGAGNKGRDLIGKERARDIVVNIALPALYLYSVDIADGQLKSTVQELYRQHPRLSENGITRSMTSQLWSEKVQFQKGCSTAQQQQGLIGLHKLYCRPLRCTDYLSLTG